jgi:hypothetical protein
MLLSSTLELGEYVGEIDLSVLDNELFEIGAPSLVNPLLLVRLESLLVKFSHKPEARPLVEEIKFLVVFVGLLIVISACDENGILIAVGGVFLRLQRRNLLLFNFKLFGGIGYSLVIHPRLCNTLCM